MEWQLHHTWTQHVWSPSQGLSVYGMATLRANPTSPRRAHALSCTLQCAPKAQRPLWDGGGPALTQGQQTN